MIANLHVPCQAFWLYLEMYNNYNICFSDHYTVF